jgi:hypothetical protein
MLKKSFTTVDEQLTWKEVVYRNPTDTDTVSCKCIYLAVFGSDPEMKILNMYAGFQYMKDFCCACTFIVQITIHNNSNNNNYSNLSVFQSVVVEVHCPTTFAAL